MHRLIAASMILSIVASAHAESNFAYDTEISTAYARTSSNLDMKATTFTVDVEHYLDDVNVSSHPLAEAAFLEHASSVDFEGYSSAIEENGASGDELGFDIGIHYTLGALPFVASTRVGGSTLQGDGSDTRLGTSVFDVGIGAYATPSTFIGVEYSRTHQRLSSASSGTLDQESWSNVGVNAKSVFEFSGDSALAVMAAWGRTTFDDGSIDDITMVNFGVQYYANRETSLGVGLSNGNLGAGGDSRSHFVVLQWFFIPEASVSFSYAQMSLDDPGFSGAQEQKAFMAGLTGRM